VQLNKVSLFADTQPMQRYAKAGTDFSGVYFGFFFWYLLSAKKSSLWKKNLFSFTPPETAGSFNCFQNQEPVELQKKNCCYCVSSLRILRK